MHKLTALSLFCPAARTGCQLTGEYCPRTVYKSSVRAPLSVVYRLYVTTNVTVTLLPACIMKCGIHHDMCTKSFKRLLHKLTMQLEKSIH